MGYAENSASIIQASALQGKSHRIASPNKHLFLSFLSDHSTLRKLVLVRQCTELAPAESAESRAPDRVLIINYCAVSYGHIHYPPSLLARAGHTQTVNKEVGLLYMEKGRERLGKPCAAGDLPRFYDSQHSRCIAGTSWLSHNIFCI